MLPRPLEESTPERQNPLDSSACLLLSKVSVLDFLLVEVTHMEVTYMLEGKTKMFKLPMYFSISHSIFCYISEVKTNMYMVLLTTLNDTRQKLTLQMAL